MRRLKAFGENVHGRPTARPLSVLLLALLFVMRPAVAAPSIDDDKVTQAIETEMLTDPAVDSYMLDVNTVDGVVTLSGSVDNILEKNRAVQIARSVKGVRSVVNQIDVLAEERSDKAIRQDVERALFSDPAADSFEIDVQAEDGTVTLTGAVQSWQEKQLSAKVAKSVRGVRQLKNNIEIEYQTNRRDGEILHDVQRRLEMDVWVESGRINVDVNDGVVKLSGAVGSAIEKSHAVSDAWVAGVQDVKAKELEVRPQMDEDLQREFRHAYKSDEEIREAVEDAFLYDPRVYSFKPEVRVENGVVTLSGVVDNLKAKQAAARDARNTVGVTRVKNHIKVRPGSEVTDKKLAGQVREALVQDPYVDRFDLEVVAHNGKVYLDGRVDSFFEKFRAEDVASRVKGVVDVQNNILAEAGPYGSDFQTWSPYGDFDPYYIPEGDKSDWALKQDVESQLFWSPYVDSDQVQVSVDNGVVTLEGTVDSAMERGAARDNAYQAGAEKVNNRIDIKGETAG